MSEFRLMREGEAHVITDMGRLFFDEAQRPGTWNPGFFAQYVETSIRDGRMFVLIDSSDRPMFSIGVSIGVDPFTGDLLAAENFWFMHPDARGKACSAVALIAASEIEAKNRGCKSMWMLCLPHLRGEAIGRLYRRYGYKHLETCYEKRL